MKWVVLLLLIMPAAFGATIEGTVYDIGLEKIENAVVRINTTPIQTKVVTDGTYRFDVPKGDYVLNASSNGFLVEEPITITDERSYTVDLILFSTLDEQLLEELPVVDVEVREDFFDDKPPSAWVAWLFVFAIVLGLAYLFAKNQRKEEHRTVVKDELHKLLDFIEKEGGRTTQKEIRKAFPRSEAKISLMIHELENKGLVERIKKGRGNIIIKK